MSSLGSVRKRIAIFNKQTTLDPASEAVLNPLLDGLIAEIRAEHGATAKYPPHPMKYPQHPNPEKGSVFGGECNRTDCHDVDATYYNRGTYGYYCRWCGSAINGRDPKPLCVEVQNDLTHEEMNERVRY